MSKGNATEADIIAMIFEGTDPSWRAGSNLFVSLHTADPGEAGTQATSECAYTSYARVLTAKGTDWNSSGNQSTNANDVVFPTCTGGTETATHFAVGISSSGATQILYKGALTAPLAISNLIQPRFTAGALVVSED